jgi:dTDP-glucose 4,6-dehydratase
MKIAVSGTDYVGSTTIRHIVNVNKINYIGNLESLALIENDVRYTFKQVDIYDANEIKV